MSREVLWQGEVSVKAKNIDGLNRALSEIKELPSELKNQYIAELTIGTMLVEWPKGLYAVLMAVGKDKFPNEAVRDGIHYFTNPLDNSKANELVNIFRMHQDKLSPEVKADMSFQMLPYMDSELVSKVESLGLSTLSDLGDKYSPTMHGAMSRHGGDGAKMAEVLKSAPEPVRERAYAQMAKQPNLDVYSKSFIDGIKDDPVYQRSIAPAIDFPSLEQSSFSVNPNSTFASLQPAPGQRERKGSDFDMN